MFTWLNSQAVRSDRGFEVESMGRFSVHYREDNRVVDVYVERGVSNGKSAVIIGSNAFERWDGDSSDTRLPSDKQEEMMANFIEAMEFQGLTVVIS